MPNAKTKQTKKKEKKSVRRAGNDKPYRLEDSRGWELKINPTDYIIGKQKKKSKIMGR